MSIYKYIYQNSVQYNINQKIQNKIYYITNYYKNIKYILVPYNTVSGGGLLKCINISKMEVDGIKCKKKFLIGLVPSINIDGVDSIINEKIMEGL